MISSANRALRILEAIGRAKLPISVAELARDHAVASGTAFRSLDALEKLGYAEKHKFSSRYIPGPVVNQLRQSVLSRFKLRDVGVPYLHQLAFASGETASLTVRVGWYGLRLAAALGSNEVTNSPPVGEIRLLERNYAGRAILSSFPATTLARYREWTIRSNYTSISTSSTFVEELRTTRERGFAIELTTFAQGRAAVAFALHDDTSPIASIAIEGPVLQFDAPRFHETLGQWTDIVRALQKVVAARPTEFSGPFAHLDPSTIAFASAD